MEEKFQLLKTLCILGKGSRDSLTGTGTELNGPFLEASFCVTGRYHASFQRMEENRVNRSTNSSDNCGPHQQSEWHNKHNGKMLAHNPWW